MRSFNSLSRSVSALGSTEIAILMVCLNGLRAHPVRKWVPPYNP